MLLLPVFSGVATVVAHPKFFDNRMKEEAQDEVLAPTEMHSTPSTGKPGITSDDRFVPLFQNNILATPVFTDVGILENSVLQ